MRFWGAKFSQLVGKQGETNPSGLVAECREQDGFVSPLAGPRKRLQATFIIRDVSKDCK
jgi:hypothetical protein